jgi:hypothetical protein
MSWLLKLLIIGAMESVTPLLQLVEILYSPSVCAMCRSVYSAIFPALFELLLPHATNTAVAAAVGDAYYIYVV